MNNKSVIKNIWDFKDEIEALKEKNSELKVLDLGCGNGNTFYHFYHQFKITNYLGIQCFEIIESLEKDQLSYFLLKKRN